MNLVAAMEAMEAASREMIERERAAKAELLSALEALIAAEDGTMDDMDRALRQAHAAMERAKA
jgi:hypothetical protein